MSAGISILLPPDLPREIRVGHRVVQIRAFAEAGARAQDHLGEAHPTNGQILLEPVQPDVELANTVLHELMHHLWHQYSLDGGTEERVVNSLTNGLCALIQNNPALVAYLLRALDSEINPDGAGHLHEPPKRSRRRPRA